MMVFTGLVAPNATALALSGQAPRVAGSGSALLGTLQFGLGSTLAATAGMTGPVTLASMNTVMLLTAIGAFAVFALSARRTMRPAVQGQAPAEETVPDAEDVAAAESVVLTDSVPHTEDTTVGPETDAVGDSLEDGAGSVARPETVGTRG